MNGLPKPCYVMSEPHLSGYRVVLGYETLTEAQDAQSALAASPPAREEAPAEGAVSDADILRDTVPADLLDAELARLNDFWGVRMEGSEHVYPSVRATESGAQKLASRLNALSSEGPRYVTVALRNRTSEPEAGAVGVVCGTAQADMHTADLPVGTKLYTHPAPATADKLRVAREALEKANKFLNACVDAGELTPDDESENPADIVDAINATLAALNEQPQ